MKTVIDPNKVQLAEKDIEDWLYENPTSLGVDRWIGRQVRVPSGIIDLLGDCSGGPYHYPVVVEVKNVEASAPAILQVCRYAYDIGSVVDVLKNREDDYSATFVRKVVVFKGGVTDDILYAANALNVELRSFQVSLILGYSE